jgi:hypothetical protein
MDQRFVNQLRAKTQEGIAAGQKQRLEAQRAEREKLRLEQEAREKAAEFILNQLPRTCEKIAAAGENEVRVYRLKYGDDYNNLPQVEGHPQLERGSAAAILKVALEKIGFQVEFRFDHDGVGMNSWYELYIKW